jgi:2-haloacid dehalogenase
VGDRWATFDCYGTLVDWNAGILAELGRVFGDDRAAELLARYHALEPEIQAERPSLSYRQVMAEAMRRLDAPVGEEEALGQSLPEWPVFDEVPAALRDARDRGWRLALLSNSDRDLIDASVERIGVPFDLAIVAGEIGSYKPAPTHWERFYSETDVDQERHVHVAQSHFHDVVPASALGIRTIWINRLGERREPSPTRELRDLELLPETLDELVPR